MMTDQQIMTYKNHLAYVYVENSVKTRVSINTKKKNLLTETMRFNMGSDFLDQSLMFPGKIRIAFALGTTKLLKNPKKKSFCFLRMPRLYSCGVQVQR